MLETGFDRFWAAWPKNPRKGAKQECLKKWKKYYCETCADQIIKHVAWMTTNELLLTHYAQLVLRLFCFQTLVEVFLTFWLDSEE